MRRQPVGRDVARDDLGTLLGPVGDAEPRVGRREGGDAHRVGQGEQCQALAMQPVAEEIGRSAARVAVGDARQHPAPGDEHHQRRVRARRREPDQHGKARGVLERFAGVEGRSCGRIGRARVGHGRPGAGKCRGEADQDDAQDPPEMSHRRTDREDWSADQRRDGGPRQAGAACHGSAPAGPGLPTGVLARTSAPAGPGLQAPPCPRSAACPRPWPTASPPARWSSGRPRWSRSWSRTRSTPAPPGSRWRWRPAARR